MLYRINQTSNIMIDTNTRKEIATAIAKCIAYRNVGNSDMVDVWAIKLLRLLECNAIVAHIER